MDPAKKQIKLQEQEKEAISNNEICPHCKTTLKSIYVPPINKTLHFCKKCNYRASISASAESNSIQE